MSTTINMDKFKELKEAGTVLSGVVRMAQYSPIFSEDALVLEYDQVKLYIPRKEVEIREIKHSFIKYVGQDIQFIITEVNEEEGYLVASSRIVKQAQRETQLAEIFGPDHDLEREAKVVKVLTYGAYVEIDGLVALLQNKDFSQDYTTVLDELNVGDTINVKFSKAKPAKIYVEAVEKICHETNMTIHDLIPGQLVTGMIRTIKPWGCYTNLLPNLDGLSPVPQYFEVAEGMKVIFKINQVREDEGRIRGKIVRILPREGEEIIETPRDITDYDSITL